FLRLPPTSTLFPYTTLFRSHIQPGNAPARRRGRHTRPPRGGSLVLPAADFEPAPLERPRHATPRGHRHHRRHRRRRRRRQRRDRSEEHTSELQSLAYLVCRL